MKDFTSVGATEGRTIGYEERMHTVETVVVPMGAYIKENIPYSKYQSLVLIINAFRLGHAFHHMFVSPLREPALIRS